MTTIERIQAMQDNNIRNALDGQRREIALKLKSVLKDLTQDYSDLPEAEQIEVYKALIEDLMRDVDYAGINYEKYC